MKENYIVINGKRAELTEEQLKALGIKEENDSPFDVKKGESYYFISHAGVCESKHIKDREAIREPFIKNANACKNKSLMEQQYLRELLNRLLWKFSIENGELENEWNGENVHYTIYWDNSSECFEVMDRWATKCVNAVWFPTYEIAKRAINEIVLPFMEKHPNFVI